MDLKIIKVAYISLALLVTLCAIGAAYLHQRYVALGLIVLASAILLGGSLLFSYIYKKEITGLKKK